MPKRQVDEKVKTTLRLPRELWKALRIQAVEEESSAEALVVKAIQTYLGKKGGRS